MNSSNALNPISFPLKDLRLIEASAGTGKTWTIAALYVRLVLGHGTAETGFGKALLPPEILVVTFTEAATKELRDRIRQRLSQAARCFRRLEPADGFLASLMADYGEENWPGCARLLEVAALWMDEAGVYTIHSWCNRMLRQHAFDSGSLFKLDIETQDGELLLEVARDYWRTFFYPLSAEATQGVLKFASNPDDLLSKVRPLLGQTDAHWQLGEDTVNPAQDPGSLLQAWGVWQSKRQALEDEARKQWREHRSGIEASLRTASEQGWLNGSKYRKDSFAQRLLAIALWAEAGESCDEQWLESFAQSKIAMNKKYVDKQPQSSAFVALDVWANSKEKEPEYSLGLLVHAAAWIEQRFDSEKQRRATMGYDDMLKHLDKALQREGGARLAEVIRRQYPVALIDEFQDTDPIQYRIFSAVYGGAQKQAALFLIGDPKQAIYSFRGADIHTYLQARKATAGRHYSLDTNFRSSHGMVAAVNRCFELADTYPEGAFRFAQADEENPLPFLAVKANGTESVWQVEGKTAPALTLWAYQSPEGDAISLTRYRPALAQAAATEIVRLLNLSAQGKAGFVRQGQLKPLEPADIAILVRDRMEASAIRLALAERRVRSVYLSDRESVYQSQEALDMLLWLKACAEPESDRRLRAALGTITLGLDFVQLERLNTDEQHLEAVVEQFKAYQLTWRYQGVLPLLRGLMSDYQVPSRMLQLQEGERRLTNLLHLAELLQSASVELDGEQALIRYLEEAIADAASAGDAALLRLESDAALIKVVTIHKSKGLEYPLVFLPFICSFRENNKGAFYRFHDEKGELKLDFSKSETGKERTGLERMQEDLRLLYVALTRSRHACWLGIAPVKSGNVKETHLHKSALGYLLKGGQPIPSNELQGLLQTLQGECTDILICPSPTPSAEIYTPQSRSPQLRPARRCDQRIAEPWWIASYSALKLAETVEPLQSNLPPQLEPPDTPRQANLEEADEPTPPVPTLFHGSDMHRFPRGAKPGTFLHGLMEWAAQEGFAKVAERKVWRKDNIARRCYTRNWDNWILPLDEWMEQMLNLPIKVGSLAELPRKAYQPELEFWFGSVAVDTLALDRLVTEHTLGGVARSPLQADTLNGMLKGFMDLVYEQAGQFYVLDYKSNWLGADSSFYTEPRMAEAVLEKRYELQYSLYLLALHRQLRARLGAEYDYDTHIGGAVYVFLRGLDGPAQGLHFEKPSKVLIESLDQLFAGQTHCH